MIEVEVKGRVSGGEQLERINQFISDWRYLGEETQDDTYLSHPVRDLGQTDEALRIRRVGTDVLLTYKGPKFDKVTKTREEIEVEVPPDLERILERLGFKSVARVAKTRRNYSKGNIVLSIDEVEDLGTFIELESASNVPEEANKLLEILESLGLESETRSYLELFLGESS